MRRPTAFTLFGVAFMAVMIAVALQFAGIGRGGRHGEGLLYAMGFTAFADALFIGILWRGGPRWRLAAVAGMMPTLFTVYNCVRLAAFVVQW